MENKNWGFCDLSLGNTFDLNKLNIVEQLGYKTVAVNTRVEEPSEEPKKKKKKGDTKEKQDYIPAPLNIPDETISKTNVNILQRVTIEFSDSSIAHKLNQSENLKKYDLIAVIPKTLQAFQYACGTLDVDIISFEPENRIPFKIPRKLYNQATERGLFFELMYTPATRDSTCRRNIISTAHTYHAVGKSVNVIITSWAENLAQIRDVHDVINLGFIFGLNCNESIDVIRNNGRRVILKGNGRRCGKLSVAIQKSEEPTENVSL